MTIMRLASGYLGAEPLKPLHLQVLHRHDWLKRNGHGDDSHTDRMARAQKIGNELGLPRNEAWSHLLRGEEERANAG